MASPPIRTIRRGRRQVAAGGGRKPELPERVSALVTQNANAYGEGLGAGFGIKAQYTDGALVEYDQEIAAYIRAFLGFNSLGNKH
jgi:hypothetical protein